jgi:hypothetical protein
MKTGCDVEVSNADCADDDKGLCKAMRNKCSLRPLTCQNGTYYVIFVSIF